MYKRLLYCFIAIFIQLWISPLKEAYADVNLKYVLTIEKGSPTTHVQLSISNNGDSYLDMQFRNEAQSQGIESHVSNMKATSAGTSLSMSDTGDGTWRINSPGDTVTVAYDIDKIIYYDWDHLYESNELAVYVDDEYAFFMAPFILIYPDTNIASIQVNFNAPSNWTILTPYSEEEDHYTVENSGTSLLNSLLNRQQIYMGKMKFYAEELVGSCKVQMGVPQGCDNTWELQTSKDVRNYVHSTALALSQFETIFGQNPFPVYTMYPNLGEYLDGKYHSFTGGRYLGNGLQYWPEHRWCELTGHMSLSFMSKWFDSPLRVNSNIEKGIGEMYYGHTLAWQLFNDKTYLAQMYYWYLVYERMHGTWMTDALFSGSEEYSTYVKGEWVALYLDKKIQQMTQGSKSLGTVMKKLYSDHKKTDHEVTYQDLQNEVESVTGSDFSTFFAQYVNNDNKLPVYQYVKPYRKYFRDLPGILEKMHHLKLYGKTIPLFVLIEMATNLQEHIMAGIYYQPYLDHFADSITSFQRIANITENDVESTLSQLTGKDCKGFFDQWADSFGRLSLEEMKKWLYDYKMDPATFSVDIKANCMDIPFETLSGKSVSISVILNPVDHTNKNADWWVVQSTPLGQWKHYDLPSGSMVSGLSPTHQGPLFNIGTTEILNTTLTVGTHAFYFGVDLEMNGELNMDNICYDSVTISVKEP